MLRFLISAAASILIANPVAAGARTETAIFAGGCYWGVEGVFEHVRGVRSVVSGFAGNGRGSAEAVRIQFDPAVVTYADLLKIHATVAHDPGQLNRQGPDVGPSYRSAIFPQSAEQRRIAQQYLARLGKVRRVVTRIEGGSFRLAPANHQDFVRRNPRHPYVVRNDLSKIAALKRDYPRFWKN